MGLLVPHSLSKEEGRLSRLVSHCCCPLTGCHSKCPRPRPQPSAGGQTRWVGMGGDGLNRLLRGGYSCTWRGDEPCYCHCCASTLLPRPFICVTSHGALPGGLQGAQCANVAAPLSAVEPRALAHSHMCSPLQCTPPRTPKQIPSRRCRAGEGQRSYLVQDEISREEDALPSMLPSTPRPPVTHLASQQTNPVPDATRTEGTGSPPLCTC